MPRSGPTRNPGRGNFSPCPPLSVTNSGYSLKKAHVKIAENHVNLREDSSPFFPMLFSMKFDKLSAYNRYFAGRLVSIFQVLIAFKFELAAYYKKLFLAGKQSLFLRIFPFFYFFLVNSKKFDNLPTYFNQRSSLC